jgi:hypothetical protein
MKYLDLDTVKKQCSVDDWFHDDDEYLMSLGDVAENMVETDLDCDLSSVCVDNRLPDSVRHAMLLLVAHFYRNRESVVFGSAVELPLGYEFLVSQFRNYKNFQS